MMDGNASSLTLQAPNMNPGGGRFDFDDGGSYCGGWQEGKAHGHGVCTGPKNVGEYSGSWNFGYEMSGVYRWKNGAIYEGRWQNGKRHGVGVEYNGKWNYRGEWSQGSKGRYGVKASSNSAVKYEGTWANGLQDGYGSETYSDGGYYQGQMCRGLRQGYGVRKSAPYGDRDLNDPIKNGQTIGLSAAANATSSMLIHTDTLQSTSAGNSIDLEDDSPKLEDGFKPNIDRTLVSKNGFVLVAKPLDVPTQHSSNIISSIASSSKYNGGDNSRGSNRRNSLSNKFIAHIPGSNQSFLKGLLRQKSTSDLETTGGRSSSALYQHQSGKLQNQQQTDDLPPIVPFTLSAEELDITDPTTVETYTGEWIQDKRNGYGICERSDGLKYEGQWHNDMKCGYGVTTFKDGSKEEGKYKNNILINDSKAKKLFQWNTANIRRKIEDSVKMAQQSQTTALTKAEIADTRAASARDKADQAATAALEAQRDSQIAFEVAQQYSNSQQLQQQQQFALAAQSAAAGGVQGSFMMPPLIQLGGDPMQVPNNLQLGYSPSSLQIRRISSQQQQQGLNRFNTFQQQPPTNMILTDQWRQQQLESPNMDMGTSAELRAGPMQQQAQYSVEPFNGRRGSFRGGGSQPSSGYQSGFMSARGANNQLGGHFERQPSQRGARPFIKQTSDPFEDIFDHYKPARSRNSSFHRRPPGKQASLDYERSRASMPRQLGPSRAGSGERLSRFQMTSSLDQTNEQYQLSSNDQEQLKRLVTSGDELEPQQQQPQSEPTGSQQVDPMSGRPTPTGSSYIQSGGSSYLGANQTPPPETNSSFRSPNNQQYYGQQQQQQFSSGEQPFQYQYQSHLIKQQRDVQSLADERLYLAGRRAFGDGSIVSEYANYDFAISSGPRMATRCRRRTASLSRNTPILGQQQQNHQKGSATTINTMSASSCFGAISRHNQLQQQQSSSKQATQTTITVSGAREAALGTSLASLVANHANESPNSAALQPSHHLMPSQDSLSSGGLIHRKPSLQVRYDPHELGGLMSREEVAALSHAQREQKRLEVEMAEKRAKQPLLHIWLSVKEFISKQRLLISVLMINIFLFKMFADLIV